FTENIKPRTSGIHQRQGPRPRLADAKLAHERGFSETGILSCRLAQRLRRAFGVENVVGDLEGETEILRIVHQRASLSLAGLGEQGAGLAGETDQGPGLEALQMGNAL